MKLRRIIPLASSLLLLGLLTPTISSCSNIEQSEEKAKININSEFGYVNLTVDGHQLFEENPTLSYGKKVDVEVISFDDYFVSSVYLDEELISNSNIFSFEVPAKESVSLNINFDTLDESCKLIINESEHGQVKIKNKDIVLNKIELGTKVEFEVVPENGYALDKLTINEKDITKDLYYNFETPNEICHLTATFKKFTSSGFDYLYGNKNIKPTRGSLGSYDAYYEPVRGLKGPELKAGLNKLIKNHVTFGYSTLNGTMLVTDVDPFDNNKIILTYEGSFNKGVAFNKEHTWAKSIGDFGTGQGPGSDMHHLRPSNSTLNGKRGNFAFGEVTNGTDCGTGFDWGRPSMVGNLVGGQRFEPKDEFKGDVARMIFYMATRYEGGDGYLDLEVGGSNGSISGIDSNKYYTFSGAKGIHGSFNDLYKWATGTIDPVSDFEVNRNNLIDEKYQHNRNPFIDHPEFVQMIYDKNYNGPGALIDK